MNTQYDNPDIVERNNENVNNQAVNSVPLSENVQVDASVTHEASWGETDIRETPKEEKINQEMPMDVTNPHETPVGETIVHEKLLSETSAHEAPVVTNVPLSASLLNREESEHFHTRWNEIQGRFVDEPRSAVEKADELVTEVIELITEMFNNEHRSLEAQWNKGNDVSTEDLRIALQRYRSFFNSLVV